MSKLQKFFEFRVSSHDLEREFFNWVGSKLGITIGEYLGGGVEGQVYAIDKFRAIKFGYTGNSLDSARHLSSKNIPGVMKIYQTGMVIAPKKFKGDVSNRGYVGYEYDGISFLDPERTDGPNDYKIGYMIMERLTAPKELQDKLEIIDTYIWGKFVRMKWVKEDGAQTRVTDLEGYHDSTIKAIEKSLNGFGSQSLKTLFKNCKNKEYVDDFIDCMWNVEEFETDFRNSKGEKVVYKYDSKLQKELIGMVEKLVEIFKNIQNIGMDWNDVHSGQFGYNSKGELVAYDVSFGWGEYDRETKITTYPPEQIRASKMKKKNIIREFNEFKTK